MPQELIRVGIVGRNSGESYASFALVPALQSMPEANRIAGVVNNSIESSKRAADVLAIHLAFPRAEELIASPEIDAVTVTITVPQHLAAVKAALKEGKHVYCEALLDNGLAEAQGMAPLA